MGGCLAAGSWMNSCLMSAQDWAEAEFGQVDSGDTRRTERLVEVAAAMGLRPGASLPCAMESAAELKAAYRLFGRKELTHPALIENHCERIRQECRNLRRCLIIPDTTQIDYSPHLATIGLGPLEEDYHRGFLLHSTLAVAISESQVSGKMGALQISHQRELLGLFSQKLWTRPEKKAGEKRSKKDRWRGNTTRSRESDRWMEALEGEQCPQGGQWIYVADRESDIYECLQGCQQKGMDFVIRASHARALNQSQGNVFEAVANAPLLGTTELKLRARHGVKARTAIMELRVMTLELRGPSRPGGRLDPLTLTVVEAREKGAQAKNKNSTEKEKALHWVLLTSLPAGTLMEALEVVAIYRERWLIEDYHKALKTGTSVESFQLGTAQALESVIGITALLAVRLLGLQLLAAACPDTPLPKDCADPQVLAVLEYRSKRKSNGCWTVGEYLRALAKLGGFLGRKSDGSPGWITIWRGIRELSAILTFLDFQASREKCG